MEEILDAPDAKDKVYKKSMITFAAFLAGPLIAAYFLAENFKVINKREYVPKTWLIAIAIMAFVLYGSFNLEIFDELPSYVFTVLYIVISSFTYSKLQEEEINNHIAEEGTFHSWGRAILITVIGFIITVTPVIIYFWDEISLLLN